MPAQAQFRKKRRPVLTLLASVGLAVYFGYHLIQGDRGILSLTVLEREVFEKKEDFQHLEQKEKALRHRVQLLRPQTLDRDMVDEQARATLNFALPDEYIIVLESEIE